MKATENASIGYLCKHFEMKWKSIETKSRLKNLPLPDKEKLWEKVYSSYLNGFKCEYCGQQMLIKDPEYPYSRSFSLDHKTSIFLGGDNSLENFAVVCHRCNIIKGTMASDRLVCLKCGLEFFLVEVSTKKGDD
jgi:5-methylcytosine-specific restriction endonuclease McrA